MKLIQEAIVGVYRFTVGEEYLTISKDNEEMVNLSREEAREVVGWLYGQIGSINPGHKVKDAPISQYQISPAPSKYPMKGDEVAYDPGVRTAKQTVKVEVGDPFLGYTAPTKSADGKQAIVGIEVSDLASDAQKNGLPIIRR